MLPVLIVPAASVGASPCCLWEARLGFWWPSSLQGWERLSSSSPYLLIKRGHTACSLRSNTCIFFLLEHLTPRGNWRRAVSKIQVWEVASRLSLEYLQTELGKFLAWHRAGLTGRRLSA